MPDEEDVAAQFHLPFGLAMHLADQGACGVEIGQAALLRLGRDRLGHAMGGKDDRHAIGHLVQFLDKDRALRLQAVHHIFVVDDFMADIDRRAIGFDRLFHDDDGAVDPGAKAARGGDQQGHRRAGGGGLGHVFALRRM